MTNERSLAADMLDPDTQARAALEFSRLAPSNEAAAWAIAAAVFSLRDTMAEAMKGTVTPEPDRSQLTPEEVAEVRRWRTPLPTAMADIVADALRFRHITRNAKHMPDPEPYPGQITRYGWSVQWGAWGDQHTTLEEAIDHDMRKQS